MRLIYIRILLLLIIRLLIVLTTLLITISIEICFMLKPTLSLRKIYILWLVLIDFLKWILGIYINLLLLSKSRSICLFYVRRKYNLCELLLLFVMKLRFLLIRKEEILELYWILIVMKIISHVLLYHLPWVLLAVLFYYEGSIGVLNSQLAS